jgi:hypothetical protein
MKKFIDHQNMITAVGMDDEGNRKFRVGQDVTELIEQNKKEYNETSTKWSDELFGNKVASIPFTAVDILNKQGVMKGFEILDQKRFFACLNDPENLFFRTKKGHL